MAVADLGDALALGVVLLPEDVEVCVNTVIGNRLALQQFMKVLPLTLQPFAGIFPRRDDRYKLIDDIKTSFHAAYFYY